jgi:sulfatase maturation enzyme AslB (radical SAM superfamily)
MSSQNSVNIIYLTNQCNIDCEYCYQKNDRENSEKMVLSKEQITNDLMLITEKEPTVVSTLVLFGGEPFFYPELMYYAISEIDRIQKEFGKRFAASTTSNGIYFSSLENVNTFKSYLEKYPDVYLSLEISFDVSGNNRRVFKNGKPIYDILIQSLKNLKNANIPISIRYTIHKDNYKNFVKDMLTIIKFYDNASPKYLSKIIAGIYTSEIENILGKEELITFKQLKKEEAAYLFVKYNIPICEMNCSLCRRCKFDDFADLNYFSDDKNFKQELKSEKQFDHFTKGTNE